MGLAASRSRSGPLPLIRSRAVGCGSGLQISLGCPKVVTYLQLWFLWMGSVLECNQAYRARERESLDWGRVRERYSIKPHGAGHMCWLQTVQSHTNTRPQLQFYCFAVSCPSSYIL